MLDNPWNAPPRVNADNPGPHILPATRQLTDGEVAYLRAYLAPVRIARALRDHDTRRAIEARLNGRSVVAARGGRNLPARPSLLPLLAKIAVATVFIYALLTAALVLS